MYPECVIVSWDTLVLFLDAQNMEKRVQLDAEKKPNVYANYKHEEKHTISIFRKEIEHSHFSQLRNDRIP